MRKKNLLLESGEVSKLLYHIEESARAKQERTVKHFIEPTEGALLRATGKRHHIIFGRRGSGKSSLLYKACAVLTTDRRPIAYIDLEKFKGNTYPNVLINILIETFGAFEDWLRTAAVHPANKASFWQELFGAKPQRSAFNRKSAYALAAKLQEQVIELRHLRDAADDVEIQKTSKSGQEISHQAEAGAQVGSTGIGLSSKLAGEKKLNNSEEKQEAFHYSKTDFLHRHILDYQQLFREIARLSGGDSYLFLDDLYHIRRSDQAHVIDYFHSVAKGNNLWLKIGTIRYRTTHYINGDPPVGMKLGDDADAINLDLNLEKYNITRQFLCDILKDFMKEDRNLTLSQILGKDGIRRLVLASGGVARDFLGVFRLSVQIARERGIDENKPRYKIGATDVNHAAGEYDSTKREELKRDTDDQVVLLQEFQKIVSFCTNYTKKNIFLLPKDAPEETRAHIAELVDLRFLHKIKDRVTVRRRPGEIFEAYMLDVSQYTGSRAIRNFEIIDNWHKDPRQALRQDKLIYEPENIANFDTPKPSKIAQKSTVQYIQAALPLSDLAGDDEIDDDEEYDDEVDDDEEYDDEVDDDEEYDDEVDDE